GRPAQAQEELRRRKRGREPGPHRPARSQTGSARQRVEPAFPGPRGRRGRYSATGCAAAAERAHAPAGPRRLPRPPRSRRPGARPVSGEPSRRRPPRRSPAHRVTPYGAEAGPEIVVSGGDGLVVVVVGAGGGGGGGGGTAPMMRSAKALAPVVFTWVRSLANQS